MPTTRGPGSSGESPSGSARGSASPASAHGDAEGGQHREAADDRAAEVELRPAQRTIGRHRRERHEGTPEQSPERCRPRRGRILFSAADGRHEREREVRRGEGDQRRREQQVANLEGLAEPPVHELGRDQRDERGGSLDGDMELGIA